MEARDALLTSQSPFARADGGAQIDEDVGAFLRRRSYQLDFGRNRHYTSRQDAVAADSGVQYRHPDADC